MSCLCEGSQKPLHGKVSRRVLLSSQIARCTANMTSCVLPVMGWCSIIGPQFLIRQGWQACSIDSNHRHLMQIITHRHEVEAVPPMAQASSKAICVRKSPKAKPGTLTDYKLIVCRALRAGLVLFLGMQGDGLGRGQLQPSGAGTPQGHFSPRARWAS